MKEFTLRDTYFKFPVRIYDEASIKKTRIMEEREELAGTEPTAMEPDHVVGVTRIPYRLAKDLYWIDAYSSDRTRKEVEEEGFDFTYVYTMEGDIFICASKRLKFETLYFEYMEGMEEYNKKKALASTEEQLEELSEGEE